MPTKLEKGEEITSFQIYSQKTDNAKNDELIDGAPDDPNLIIEVLTDFVNNIQRLNKLGIRFENCEQLYTTILRDGRNGNGNLREDDTFILYKNERLVFDADSTVIPGILYYDYLKWCGINGYAIMNEKEFSMRLKELFGKPKLYSFPNDNHRLMYEGVRLKNG